MRNTRAVLTSFAVLAAMLPAGMARAAPCPVVAWSRTEASFPTGMQDLRDVAVDCAGNVIAVGYDYVHDNGDGWRVDKYDPDGNLLWSWTPGGVGASNEQVSKVAVGPDGSIVAVGFTSPPPFSLFVTARRYSPDGTLLWTVTRQGANRASVAVDRDGNAIVEGGGGGIGSPFAMQISPAGNAQLLTSWAGSFVIQDGAALDDGGFATVGFDTGKLCWIVERRDRNGSLLWSRTGGKGGFGIPNVATAVAATSVDQIVVLGAEVCATSWTIKLWKYDDQGNPVWTRDLRTSTETNVPPFPPLCYPWNYGPPPNGPSPWGAIDVDACGDLLVTGLPATSTVWYPTGGRCISYGFYAERFDGDGHLLWRWDHANPLDYLSVAVAASPDGGVIVGGVGDTGDATAAQPVDWVICKLAQPGCACAAGTRMCPQAPAPQPPAPPEPVDKGKVKIVGGVRGYLDPKRGEQATILVRPATAGDIRVRIYTMEGVLVKDMVRSTGGGHTEVLTWDATDAGGRPVPSGVYPVFIEAPGIKYRDKLVVVR